MPTYQWSYEYAQADTATVLFSGAPADASYRWQPPYDHMPRPRGVTVELTDDSTVGYQTGTARREFELNWEMLPEGNSGTATAMYGYLGVVEFFTTHTLWNNRTFGFYDHAGASEIEVRYGGMTFVRAAGGFYRGRVRLIAEL